MILPSFLSALIGLTHLSERLVSFTPAVIRKSTPEGFVYTFRGVCAAEVYVNGYLKFIKGTDMLVKAGSYESEG